MCSGEAMDEHGLALCEHTVDEGPQWRQETLQLVHVSKGRPEADVEAIVREDVLVIEGHRVCAIHDVRDTMLLQQVGILSGLLIADEYGPACCLVPPHGIQRVVETTNAFSCATAAAAAAVGTKAEPGEQLARLVVELLVVATAAEHFCGRCAQLSPRRVGFSAPPILQKRVVLPGRLQKYATIFDFFK